MSQTTHWDKIIVLEDTLESGDHKPLVEFVELLSKNDLLTRHMFAHLCENRISRQDSEMAWRLLHEFASKRD